MKRKTSASEAVAKAQRRNKAAGGGRLTLSLTPEDMEKWQQVLAMHPPERGQKMAAFRGMMESALRQGEPSKQQILAAIEKNWAD